MAFDSSLPHALPWNYPWLKDEIERRDEYIAQLEAELAHQKPQNDAHGAIEGESVKVPAEGETEAHSEPDSRKKLEADLKTHLYEFGGYCFNSREGHTDNVDTFFDDFVFLLDRQAEITERECMERATSERIGWDCAECAEGLGRELDARCDPLKQRIAELTAERDELRAECEDLEHANSRQARKIHDVCEANSKLTAERDEWKAKAKEYSQGWAKANAGWAEANAALDKLMCADEIRRLS